METDAHTHSLKHTLSIDHLRLDDGVAAIERGLAVLIPPMAAAAFAALELLTQFGNLESFTDRHMDVYRPIILTVVR